MTRTAWTSRDVSAFITGLIHLGVPEPDVLVGKLRHLDVALHHPCDRLLVQWNEVGLVVRDLEGLRQHGAALALVELDTDLLGEIVEARIGEAVRIVAAERRAGLARREDR